MAFLALALTFFVGCGQDLPAPTPTLVVPDHAWNGRDAVVGIAGRHFYPDVSVDALGRGDPDIDANYRAFLVDADGAREALGGVTLASDKHLDAVVPKGLPPGRYDLVLEGPSGVQGTLARAFTVTDTLADRLSVDATDITHQVREWASAEVALASPSGERVLQDLLVEITLESEDGSTEARFADGVLFDQVPLDDGRVGIRGRLGADGWANVGFEVETPDLVTLTASPVDEGSGIAEGGLKVEFRPGDDRRVEFELPDEPFQAEAGVAFLVRAAVVDQFGNLIDDEAVPFTIRDRCQTTSLPVVVRGQGDVRIVLSRATGTATCITNALEVVELPGASDAFTVDPGPLDHYDVATSPGPLTAGDTEYAFVTGADRFANPVVGLGGRVSVSDTVGGVASEAVVCNVVGTGAVCTFQPTQAGEDVRLVVYGPTGVRGASAAYAVVAGPAAVVDVDVTAGGAVAGTPEAVDVTVADAWGNAIAVDAVGAVSFSDDGGEVSCARSVTGAAGGIGFACTLTRASASTLLSATLPSGVSGVSSPFVVTNGLLTRVELVPASLTTTAGAALRIGFDGFDAWSNPATVLADPGIDLVDSGGDLDTTASLLGGNGAVVATFTHAGSTVVTASQAGVTLGRSAPIAVTAGVATSLVVDVVEPWGWVDVPVTADVTAVDVYGNTSSLDAAFTAETSQGDSATGELIDGRGTVALGFVEFDARATVDAATAAGLTGTSESFMVVEACPDGPTAAVRFGGYKTGIACTLSGTDTASVASSTALSTAGAEPLSRYAFVADADEATSSSTNAATLALDAGRHVVSALVVDAAGCGDDASGDVWVGADDGGAVGPISVSAADIDLGDTATVEIVAATTCTRDPADAAVVRVRSDLGAVDGASVSGEGLYITLDSSGDGSFDVDTSAIDAGGTATFTVEAFDGEARGTAAIDVDGDDRRPTVFAQSPTGYLAEDVDSVVLTFSEGLLESTVTTSAFTIVDPAGAAVSIDSVTLNASGDEVTLWLETPASGADGPFAVAASTALRDEAGNRLDGAWSGAASAYAGSFGGAGSGPASVDTCTASTSSLRPDGDDGVGVEAEAVTISASAGSKPSRWIRSVTRRGGALVLVIPVAATSSALTWSWDGRDAAGRVLEDGRYLLRTDAEDAYGERGGACTVSIDVTNGEPR